MILSSEHFPISCSLRPRLVEGIPDVADSQSMSLEDLLGYLRTPQDLDLTPYADLLNQTEAMGDPAQPTREHTAILRWVGEAMHNFEQRFPLEEPLASTVRRLKPLAAAIALVDEDFMQPDVHPLHQLLDGIQERAVGWQSRLGRVGANLEKQVLAAVEESLQWFDDQSTDLAGICADFLEASERDTLRAKRMSGRVIDAERGKAKTAAAKNNAARMINGYLEKYPAPREIGAFLRDPWYDSAQLVLLKFGSDSEQWQAMCETTELLLDSVQSMENADPERREHIVTVVTRLSKDLRQWLLSLHHDTEAVNEAMARVESVQVSLLRRESVEIGRIQPLPVTDDTSVREQSDLVIALKPVVEWHWFAIDTFSEGSVRMQLVLKDESEQRLLFANMAGMKVADYSFAQFDQLMMKKRVTALPHGGGFSLCLAVAAGVDSTEKLDALYAELALQSAGADDVSDLDDILQYQEDDVPRKESLADVLEKFSRGEYDAAAANGSPTNGGGAAAATGAGQRGELLSDEEMRGLESLIAEGEPTAPRPRRVDPVEEDNSASNDDMSLPMGIWVGFHDGDQPTQGKLAVHDAASDTYIFVDRQGGKLREIPGYQLSALMNHGLVVIMQANPVADAD